MHAFQLISKRNLGKLNLSMADCHLVDEIPWSRKYLVPSHYWYYLYSSFMDFFSKIEDC